MTPQFFKAENNDHAAEFKNCLPVNVNTSFRTLAPAIATAEEERVKPMLGTPLFERVASYYQQHGTSGESNVLNSLVVLVQMAAVRLAYYDSFDQLAVMMSDSGLSDKNGENRAYRYQADALKANLGRQGFSYLNAMVRHCETYIEELPEFEQSPYHAEMQSSLIRSLGDFQRYVQIGGDFCLFARLREFISANRDDGAAIPHRRGVGHGND